MNKFNTIVVLGGGIIKDKSGWRTTDYNEEDKFGITGARLRVEAAYHLYLNRISPLFIVSGGKGQDRNVKNARAVADIMKDELVRLGVPADVIISDTNPDNTYQQLNALLKIASEVPAQKIGLISSDWHLPRIKTMLDYVPQLTKLSEIVELISAEQILIQYDSMSWKKNIDKSRQGEKMKQRIVIEQKGINQIKEGTYKFE